MLTDIQIRDFVIVDELELPLSSGMTALTGETGAGKSILVDALGLVLGDRADTGVLRQHAERAEINACFDVSAILPAQSWLNEHDLDADGECLLRRIITREGRSRAFINGRPVPVQALKELGQFLVDIHGQHEHQSLLRNTTQRELLDDYGVHGDLHEKLTTAWREWRECRDELRRLSGSEQDRIARLDLLRFQVNELAAVQVKPGECEQLDQEHARLAHAEQLLTGCQRLQHELVEMDDGAVESTISRLARELDELAQIDPQISGGLELLNGALIQIRECADALRHYGDNMELDPQRLQEVETRIGAIFQLARKHHVDADELPKLQRGLEQELDGLANADQRVGELSAQLENLQDQYTRLATQLSTMRRKSAKRLGIQVTEVMHHLGMPGGTFMVAVRSDNTKEFTAHGMDQIEFQVSANPGQAVAPLAKVASGGELSRISLAIQVITAKDTRIPTLIFDEVDTGIGGGVAEVVGQNLRALAIDRQILCVTHLPQVASQAHQHLQVSKLAGAETTRTRIRTLTNEERVDEIARMLGGLEITASTRAHAKEMVDRVTATEKRTTRKRTKKA